MLRPHRLLSLGLAIAACVLTEACYTSLATGVRHISNSELRMAKSGRVIDVQTGLGISGAKIIMTWHTLSSGIAGYSSTGGSWCDLQKIATTDVQGNYTIPDVSEELDLSDRGTRVGVTVFGPASQTHDKEYLLTVFKPGYVRDSDRATTPAEREREKQNPIASLNAPRVPDVEFSAGTVAIKPILLRKVDLSWSDRMAYYSSIQLGCSDRMANSIAQPEARAMKQEFQTELTPTPCAMPPQTDISPDDFGEYTSLTHEGKALLDFVAKVRDLQGMKPARFYDPTEQIATKAGVMCKALGQEIPN
jgi:hypothetical protein